MGDRCFCFQFMDAFSNTFDYIGSRATGQRGGKFAVVGPDWNGNLPADLAGTIKTPTTRVWIGVRIAVADPQEIDTVRRLQMAVRFGTLSGEPTPTGNPKFSPLPPPEKLSSMSFFQILGDVLKAYPTPEPAQTIATRFAAIGLDSKTRFNEAGLSSDIKTVLEQGAQDGFATIDPAKLGSSVNGWDFSMKNGRFGEDYLLRSSIACRSLAGNTPEEAIYFNCNKDVDGQPLDGAQRYELRFAAGQTPPVNAFWSLTMYDGQNFWLVENPIHRYSIGSRTKGLNYGADGSLTLYIQHESPGQQKENNWLPAPAGIFDVHLRTYLPKPALLNEEYKLPPLRRAGSSSKPRPEPPKSKLRTRCCPTGESLLRANHRRYV